MVDEKLEGFTPDSGGTAENEVMCVTIRGNEADGYTADKTADEIYDAFVAGKYVFCSLNSVDGCLTAPLVASYRGLAMFSGASESGTIALRISNLGGVETFAYKFLRDTDEDKLKTWAELMVDEKLEGFTPDSGGNVDQTVAAVDYDQNVRAVNHRGFNTVAPENTIPAYILSKKNGFKYVECDVSFTSDGVCVLLHDSTIDRTSNGSGKISSMTYAQASQYDYGSWKSSAYAGTKLPTLDEFLMTCKALGLHPYIEIKNDSGTTQANVESIVAAVKAAGMKGKVTYISFNATYLGYVKAVDPSARMGYVVNSITEANVTSATGLKTDTNEVFLDCKYTAVDSTAVALCSDADIPLEVWTANSASWIEGMNPYISGVTSDSLIAGKVLYDKYIQYDEPDTPTEPDTPSEPDEPDVPEGSVTAPEVPEGYELVRTLYSEDLQYKKGSQYHIPTSNPPYTTANNNRVGYLHQDIPVEYGYRYRVDIISKYDTVQYGAQLITQAGLDLMAEGGKFSSGGTPNTQVWDSGWKNNGEEVNVPESHNNSPCKCMRLSFRMSTSNPAVVDGDIQAATISRIPV